MPSDQPDRDCCGDVRCGYFIDVPDFRISIRSGKFGSRSLCRQPERIDDGGDFLVNR